MDPDRPRSICGSRRIDTWHAALAAAGFATVSLRLAGLGVSDPWLDEPWSVLVASAPLPDVIRIAAANNNAPLYYIILHGVLFAQGFHWFWLRLPSAVASILTFAPVVGIGHWIGGRRAALMAAVLFAVNPISIFYAQTARPYALMGLLFGAAVWAYLHCRWWWGLLFALAFYTHPLAVLLLPGLCLTWLAVPRAGRTRVFHVLVIGLATAAVLCLPWLQVLIEQTGTNLTEYLGEVWQRWNPWFVPLWSIGICLGLESLPPGTFYPRIAPAYPPLLSHDPTQFAMHVVVASLVLIVGIRARRQPRLRQAALLIAGTIVGHVLVSEFLRPVLLLGRHDSPYIPLLIPVVVGALVGQTPKASWLRTAAAVAFILVFAMNTWWTTRYHLTPPHRHPPARHSDNPPDRSSGLGLRRMSLCELIARGHQPGLPFADDQA